MSAKLDLAKKIHAFLKEHGILAAEQESEKYITWNGPDSDCLYAFAIILERGDKLVYSRDMPHSDWWSGCYKPRHSESAQKAHADLIAECKKIIAKDYE